MDKDIQAAFNVASELVSVVREDPSSAAANTATTTAMLALVVGLLAQTLQEMRDFQRGRAS